MGKGVDRMNRMGWEFYRIGMSDNEEEHRTANKEHRTHKERGRVQTPNVDADPKTPESAGLAMFRKNRRLTNDEHRMSTGGIRGDSLSFDILRLGILRFCSSSGRRRSRRSFSKRLKKSFFNCGVDNRTNGSMTVGRSLFAVPCSAVSVQNGGLRRRCSRQPIPPSPGGRRRRRLRITMSSVA